eukprot:scaffold340_cov256-Pinguiococcus_pyrenoidosus.AAC.52
MLSSFQDATACTGSYFCAVSAAIISAKCSFLDAFSRISCNRRISLFLSMELMVSKARSALRSSSFLRSTSCPAWACFCFLLSTVSSGPSTASALPRSAPGCTKLTLITT